MPKRPIKAYDQLIFRSLLGWSVVALIALLFTGFGTSKVLLTVAFTLGFANITAFVIDRWTRRRA